MSGHVTPMLGPGEPQMLSVNTTQSNPRSLLQQEAFPRPHKYQVVADSTLNPEILVNHARILNVSVLSVVFILHLMIESGVAV